jgi:hypothetical protein
VVPADLAVEVAEDGVYVSLHAPSWGFRLVHLEGNSRGANPVDHLTFSWTLADDTVEDEAVTVEGISDGTAFVATTPPEGAQSLTVTDLHGNTATVSL